MQNLRWDEFEVLECLEVVPESEEDGVWFSYSVVQKHTALNLMVWPIESLIQISLLDTSNQLPVIDFSLITREGVFRKKYSELDCLEIRDCIIVPNDFQWSDSVDMFDKKVWPYGISFEITIKPQIQIKIQAVTG